MDKEAEEDDERQSRELEAPQWTGTPAFQAESEAIYARYLRVRSRKFSSFLERKPYLT